MNINSITKSEISDIQMDVINKLKDYIEFKNLEPGDKLPSERMLSEKFEVSRSNIREVIQKLEFYGILNSKPQSGTFIADIGKIAMIGMLDDILQLREPDFRSLVETRILFELEIVSLAAKRRTDEDLEKISQTLEAYKTKVLNNESAVEEDLLFHLAIARASKNATLNTFMLIITPEIITNFEKYHVCDSGMSRKGIDEHQAVFEAIKDQDSDRATEMMKNHFKVLFQYCYESE